VKSSTCLIEEDLSTGRIPAKRNEVVIFSEDESVIGTQQICYFTSKNIWNYNQYYSTMVTVVGLLKKESNQVYFSEELCHMLSLRLYGDHYSVDAAKNDLTNEYEVEGLSIIPVIGENLEYGEVRLSQDVVVLNDIALAGQAVMHAYLPGDGVELGKELTFEVMLLEEYNDQSSLFAEISKEWFYELYKHGSKQASLYIKDYVYTDYVLDKLADLGYDALSPLRVSTTDYDYDKVYERNNIIFRSLIVLLIVSILEIIIIRSLLRIRNKDFVIFRSLGMNHRTVKLINYYEMFIYTTVSVFVLIAGARILSLFPFGYLQNMIKYYNFYTYTIYITINFSVILVTVWLSNRFFRLFTGFDERFG
jgi:ABC-type antimicrobial peptide transport system permease subunit